ncbi:MAG: phosphoribosylaminoimidazolesuccinocarboxamide synthase PurC [Bacteroidetes bacterium HLUCCA01]|nr:MAG: phosphoribosylaminoimidazolesuccinocarboxamide synthase PurC [Bacteroidetes bacterium HLUCCA01]
MIDNNAALSGCVGHTYIQSLPEPYRGKVRDVYKLTPEVLAIVSTDRISAFDHILRQLIPYKGQILNTLAAFFFERVDDIIKTHILDIPHPNVTIARACTPLPVEVVVRGYLTGHAWRVYNAGGRELCGVKLPDGMIENQPFPTPILTPATKATEGHDQDISEADILRQHIIPAQIWENIRQTAFRLFDRGSQIAREKGLILVDTKYEFGLYHGELILIDEVHTPDSSRYFYSDGFEERLSNAMPQRQLSKEFIREWLMQQGFQGLDGQLMPDIHDEFRIEIYQRYEELFTKLTGHQFIPTDTRHFMTELPQIVEPWTNK